MFILSLNTNNANLWRDIKANWGHVLNMSLFFCSVNLIHSLTDLLDRLGKEIYFYLSKKIPYPRVFI